jgi:hypothetical protein
MTESKQEAKGSWGHLLGAVAVVGLVTLLVGAIPEGTKRSPATWSWRSTSAPRSTPPKWKEQPSPMCEPVARPRGCQSE